MAWWGVTEPIQEYERDETMVHFGNPGLVLFTTGYTRNAIIHQGRLDPGAELIGKPFTYATLVAKIQRLLRRAA